MEENKYMIRFQCHSIVGAAEDFYFAGKLCLDKFVQILDSHYCFPALVNLALAGEIYLKAIYILENNRESKNIHPLKALFAQISNQAQSDISRLYEQNKRKESFDQAIERYSDVFSKWRYRHEITNADSNVDDFVALIDAIKTTCEQKESQIAAGRKELEGMV